MIIITWLSSLLHFTLFIANCVLLHIPLMIARLFGRNAMDHVLHIHCFLHLFNTKLLGSKFTVHLPETDLTDSPVILVSNHQSMYDIPFIIWTLRKINPKFISKRELARWIPTISFALRNGDHILINRKNGKTAIKQIREAAKNFEATNGSISIFPEGTRSRSLKIQNFKLPGFAALVESMPSAKIIPITMDGTGKVTGKLLFPAPRNVPVLIHVHEPISKEEKSPQALLDECYEIISKKLTEWRKPTTN